MLEGEPKNEKAPIQNIGIDLIIQIEFWGQ